MAVNIIMEKSTFTGRDSSGKEHYRAVMLADTTDELPAREWNGIVLDQGSSITSIGEGTEYMMNSAGAWVRQGGGGSSLPEVTADDNGNVLTVVDGEWDKAAPTKELPTVTSSDNNKVLTVVGGQWAKAAPSSDSPIKIVNTTYSGSGRTITFIGETQKSIYQAVAAGKIVIIKAHADGEYIRGTGLYMCTCFNNYNANFTCYSRNYDMYSDINYFNVDYNDTTNTVLYSHSRTEDYSSGGPV